MGLLLQRVVVHRRSRLHPAFDIAAFQHVEGTDSGIAVGLKFNADGNAVSPKLRSTATVQGPQQVLGVVTILIGDNIGTGELARSPEALAKLIEESEIEINASVAGAIKGPGLSLASATASGRDLAVRPEGGRYKARAAFLHQG